jgi:hypothetical protein
MSFVNVEADYINWSPVGPSSYGPYGNLANGVSTYYVSAAIGKDTNRGSYEFPVATIGAALALIGGIPPVYPRMSRVIVTDGQIYSELPNSGLIVMPDNVIIEAPMATINADITYAGANVAQITAQVFLGDIDSAGAGVLTLTGSSCAGIIVQASTTGGTIVANITEITGNVSNVGTSAMLKINCVLCAGNAGCTSTGNLVLNVDVMTGTTTNSGGGVFVLAQSVSGTAGVNVTGPLYLLNTPLLASAGAAVKMGFTKTIAAVKTLRTSLGRAARK